MTSTDNYKGIPEKIINSLKKRGWEPNYNTGNTIAVLTRKISRYITAILYYYEPKKSYLLQMNFNYGIVPNLDVLFNTEGDDFAYVSAEYMKDLKQLDQQMVILRLKFLKGFSLMKAKVLDNTK